MIPGLAVSPQKVRSTWLDQLEGTTFLGIVVLGIISSLLASGPWLAFMISILILALLWTGLNPATQWEAMRPWLPVVGFVLVIHVFTTTAAAPLGHPSWGGLRAGVLGLARIGLALGWLSLFARLKSLDELVQGIRWWMQPLAKVGLQTDQLALVLAVALGTIPGVMSEGRRVDAVLRMRRAVPNGGKVSRWRRFLDKVLVIMPLMESLMRRAEVLSLSLRTRQPAVGVPLMGPPIWQLAGLVLWLVLIIWWIRPGVTL